MFVVPASPAFWAVAAALSRRAASLPTNGDPAGAGPLLQREVARPRCGEHSSDHFPNFSQKRFSLAFCLPLASRRKGARTARFMIHLFRTLSGQRNGRKKSTKRTTL